MINDNSPVTILGGAQRRQKYKFAVCQELSSLPTLFGFSLFFYYCFHRSRLPFRICRFLYFVTSSLVVASVGAVDCSVPPRPPRSSSVALTYCCSVILIFFSPSISSLPECSRLRHWAAAHRGGVVDNNTASQQWSTRLRRPDG